MKPDDPRHGTLNGYTTHKCRCELCKKAQRDYACKRKQKQIIYIKRLEEENRYLHERIKQLTEAL
jgi:hypothetical protein